MSLSMEEERILTGIASQLGEDDPRLADRLARFGQPRPHRPRRRVRIRTIALTVVVIIVVAALIGAAFVAVPS